MQLLKRTPNIDFMGHRRLAMGISGVLMVLSLGIILFRGLNFGIDFTGGLLLEVSYSEPAQLEAVREILANEGYETALVQNFGSASDVLIRLPPVADPEAGETLAARLLDALRAEDPAVELLRTEFVGPQVGEDLAEQGGLAMLFATIMIFVYVMVRFRWKFAAGAIASLVHDVVITVGFYAALGLAFDLTILAAVLTVIGYSLNDTIVVFDRIRENFRAMRRGTPEQIVNASLNQTLARTLMTGITTLLVLMGLATLGGQTLFGFSIALIFGILIGTYSSIYIASAALLELKVSTADLVAAKRDEVDELP
jgi:preprotein translocase subunit SecF